MVSHAHAIDPVPIEALRERYLRLVDDPRLASWFWHRGLLPAELAVVQDVLGYIAADLKHALEEGRQNEILARDEAEALARSIEATAAPRMRVAV